MFGKKDEKNLDNIETIIGPSVLVKGDFTSNGNVSVEGDLEGKIESSGCVSVGKNAKITADIEAKSAEVAGEVKGELKVKENLIIKSGAKITGNVVCSSISIEEGGILNGRCNMLSKATNERGKRTEDIKPAQLKDKTDKEE